MQAVTAKATAGLEVLNTRPRRHAFHPARVGMSEAEHS